MDESGCVYERFNVKTLSLVTYHLILADYISFLARSNRVTTTEGKDEEKEDEGRKNMREEKSREGSRGMYKNTQRCIYHMQTKVYTRA